MQSTPVLVLLGHPNTESFCDALARSYIQGIEAEHLPVAYFRLSDLTFDPILHKGYKEIQTIETDIAQLQEAIRNAKHIVIVHPLWWGSIPALLKGCIERILLPGFGFRYRKDSPFWNKLLLGKSGRIIYTADSPWWYHTIFLGNPGVRTLKHAILQFCGIRPVYITAYTSVRFRTDQWRTRAIQKTYAIGVRDARKIKKLLRQ